MNFQPTNHPSIQTCLTTLFLSFLLPYKLLTSIDICCCCCLLQKSCCGCYTVLISINCLLIKQNTRYILSRELLIRQISTQSLSYIVEIKVSFKRDHQANCCMLRDIQDISSETTNGEICSYQYSSITCFLWGSLWCLDIL